MKTSPEEIENRIAEIDPEVEFLTVENAGGDALRIYIDHPGGVNLEICQKVTSGLGELLEDHTLEVSSPGPHRPLTKPSHYARFEGRRQRCERPNRLRAAEISPGRSSRPASVTSRSAATGNSSEFHFRALNAPILCR